MLMSYIARMDKTLIFGVKLLKGPQEYNKE